MNTDIKLDWDDEEDPQRGMHREMHSGMHSPGARVLVADDDEDTRHLVTSTLESEGYEVNEASSGTDLLRALEPITMDLQSPDGVDLIVLDQRMPGMSGLEIVRRLRAAHWVTPAILMTGFAEPNIVAEAARLGVPVLSKPFALETLTETALSLLVDQGNTNHNDTRHGLKLAS